MNRIVKLARILSVPSYASALMLHRSAAAVEHCSVLRGLEFNTVIDVGANRGQFALVARRCFPSAELVSFEPLPAPFLLLQAVLGDDQHATAHQVALGEVAGDATIHVPHKDHSSSLLPITDLQNTVFPGTAEESTQTIRVARLSDLVKPEVILAPALLKLDVQGYELSVLKGSADVLDRFAYVYVECSFVELYEGQALAGDVISWLSDKGYSLRGVHNTYYDSCGQAIQADFLFTNRPTS
jgi:FkbM family methyltransferase